MTFNMPGDWHHKFNTATVMNGLNMKELLIQGFGAWKPEKARDQKWSICGGERGEIVAGIHRNRD